MTEKSESSIRILVKSLEQSYQELPEIIRIEAKHQISLPAVLDIIANLQCLIFPGFFGKKTLKQDAMEYYVGELLEQVIYTLQKEIGRALRCREDDETRIAEEAQRITFAFLERLPDIRKILVTDVTATFEGDPA
ncbi:MAG: serine acetyltransferase, partial [Deltaproteobacteria bacterium]|nr:serine acetyltransferase [Deltaproteobacteria bacterium]